MSTPTIILVCVALLFVAQKASYAEVVMVYSIQRHGARNVLPKTALLQESDALGGPTLLPEGQSQANRAGAAFRARYVDAATCAAWGTCLKGTDKGTLYGVVNQPGIGFSNYNLYARSSALDRTIMTALSFLDGLLPPLNNATAARFLPDGQQVVPVYSTQDGEDILIRAYSKCAAYQSRLSSWFATPEFQAKSAESEPLRNQISSLVPALNTSLANWWNVYDAFNVWRTYGVGDPTPDVDDTTFAAMQALAYWLETSKMNSSLTSNSLGGTILADLLQRVDAAVEAVGATVQVYYKVLHLSGHYNTQLGTLAALQMDGYQPAVDTLPWLKKIPSLAALMAFEVVSNDAQPPAFAVRLVIQDGPSANYTAIPLPCAQPEDAAEAFAGPGACTLDAFRAYAGDRALTSTQWCASCQDASVSACKLGIAASQLADAQAQLASQQEAAASCNDDYAWKIAVSVMVTFVGTALLAGAAIWCS